MAVHPRILIVLTLIAALLSGCGPNVQDPHAHITSPHNGDVIVVSQTAADASGIWHWSPGTISVTADSIPPRSDGSCPYLLVMAAPRDNGGSFRGLPAGPLPTSCSGGTTQTTSYSWIPDTLGSHQLSVEFTIVLSDGSSRVFNSDAVTVCVINDRNNPVRDIQTGLVTNQCNPATPTPVPTIMVLPNPHQHNGPGSGSGSGASSGCGQYGDQTSCNLAGCSWLGGSCNVNP